jgi:beta-1,4-N-acetylglucosaminyltransferase
MAMPRQASTPVKSTAHMLVVMGEGGHTKECLRLIELMGADDYRYSYVLVTDDEVTEQKIQVAGPVYRVIRPRNKQHNIVTDALKFTRCALMSARIVHRVRPEAVITTGPSVAVPVCLVAKLMGACILYVETGSRIHRLSATGNIMRYLADLFFVQWEELLPAHRGARFAGRLF